MQRGAVRRRRHHYLCRWALGIRTRDSLSMLARPVHTASRRLRSIGHNLTCFTILPCRTSTGRQSVRGKQETVGGTGSCSREETAPNETIISHQTLVRRNIAFLLNNCVVKVIFFYSEKKIETFCYN